MEMGPESVSRLKRPCSCAFIRSANSGASVGSSGSASLTGLTGRPKAALACSVVTYFSLIIWLSV